MDGAETVVQPSGFGAVDEVGDHVKRMRVVKFCIDDVRDGFVVEVDLEMSALAPTHHRLWV